MSLFYSVSLKVFASLAFLFFPHLAISTLARIALPNVSVETALLLGLCALTPAVSVVVIHAWANLLEERLPPHWVLGVGLCGFQLFSLLPVAWVFALTPPVTQSPAVAYGVLIGYLFTLGLLAAAGGYIERTRVASPVPANSPLTGGKA